MDGPSVVPTEGGDVGFGRSASLPFSAEGAEDFVETLTPNQKARHGEIEDHLLSPAPKKVD